VRGIKFATPLGRVLINRPQAEQSSEGEERSELKIARRRTSSMTRLE